MIFCDMIYENDVSMSENESEWFRSIIGWTMQGAWQVVRILTGVSHGSSPCNIRSTTQHNTTQHSLPQLHNLSELPRYIDFYYKLVSIFNDKNNTRCMYICIILMSHSWRNRLFGDRAPRRIFGPPRAFERNFLQIVFRVYSVILRVSHSLLFAVSSKASWSSYKRSSK
jgi:hypothetical protein